MIRDLPAIDARAVLDREPRRCPRGPSGGPRGRILAGGGSPGRSIRRDPGRQLDGSPPRLRRGRAPPRSGPPGARPRRADDRLARARVGRARRLCQGGGRPERPRLRLHLRQRPCLFGGCVVRPDDASQTLDGPARQRLVWLLGCDPWEPPLVLNHLDRRALRRYARSLLPAFADALRGSTSALFCDSLEVDASPPLGPLALGPLEARTATASRALDDRTTTTGPPLRVPDDRRRRDPPRVSTRSSPPSAGSRGGDLPGPVPRGPDRPPGRLRRGLRPGVGGDPLRPALLADRRLGRRPGRRADRQRRDVHLPLRVRHPAESGASIATGTRSGSAT